MIRSSLFTLAVLQATPAAGRDLDFTDACAPGPRLTVAAVGDLVMQPFVQYKGAREGFDSLWAPLEPLLAAADVAYLNFEGAAAPDRNIWGVPLPHRDAAALTRGLALLSFPRTRAALDPLAEPYTGYPRFNYPPRIAADLRRGGFDIVSTSNNHALDRDSVGLGETLDALDRAGVCHTGTRRHDGTDGWGTLLDVKGFRLAWLGCAEHTNGAKDPHGLVRRCFEPEARAALLDEVARLRSTVDAIVVTAHWGWEYHTAPNKHQRALAVALLEAGATIVLGTHPHVPQPVERYVTADDREGLVAYSLGNFVSAHFRDGTRESFVLLVGLTRRADGRVVINGVRTVPFWMEHRQGTRRMGVRPLQTNERGPRARLAPSVDPRYEAPATPPIDTTPGCAVPEVAVGASSVTAGPTTTALADAWPFRWPTEPSCQGLPR